MTLRNHAVRFGCERTTESMRSITLTVKGNRAKGSILSSARGGTLKFSRLGFGFIDAKWWYFSIKVGTLDYATDDSTNSGLQYVSLLNRGNPDTQLTPYIHHRFFHIMNTYNPFATAFQAAISELTSDNAKRYYSLRVQADMQSVMVLVMQLGCMAYELGAQCRQWMDAYNESAIPSIEEAVIIEPQPLLSAAPVLLALPAAIAPHPDHERVLRRISKVTALPTVGDEVLITPFPVGPKAKRSTRKSANPKTAKPAARKTPTTVKAVTGALIPID
jgi:hypothetical protein